MTPTCLPSTHRSARVRPGGVEPDQRHLHEGGGPDGLDTLRLILSHTTAATVRTTAADILPIHQVEGRTCRRVLTATVSMHPAWHTLTGPQAPVSVWDLARDKA